MTNETKKELEELEQVRLELFRCVANLDERIIQARMAIDEYSADSEYTKFHIKVDRAHRNSMIKVSEWDKLKEREEVAWQKLLDSIDSN